MVHEERLQQETQERMLREEDRREHAKDMYSNYHRTSRTIKKKIGLLQKYSTEHQQTGKITVVQEANDKDDSADDFNDD